MDRNYRPALLLLHDGELTEISTALEPLGLEHVDRHGAPSESDCKQRWDVVIASSKRMLELETQLVHPPSTRIAVVDGDSRTLRNMLRRAGSHLLVRRPVHPEALRLLVLHSIYRGPEKREATRVSVGAAARFRVGWRRRSAILSELSSGGCRLLAAAGTHGARPGRRITVQLPAEVCAGQSISVKGEVVRLARTDTGADAIAVAFVGMRSAVQSRIATVVAAHREGPAILDHEAATALPPLAVKTETPAPEAAIAAETSTEGPADTEETQSEPGQPHETRKLDAGERRVASRRSLSRRIIALGEHAARVLIGRDLSVGGMRVEPTPGVKVGDSLQIALHVRAGGRPLVLNATVARDDGEAGIVLVFVDVDEASRAYLEEMVGVLPTITDGERDDSGLVVSELLEQQASDCQA